MSPDENPELHESSASLPDPDADALHDHDTAAEDADAVRPLAQSQSEGHAPTSPEVAAPPGRSQLFKRSLRTALSVVTGVGVISTLVLVAASNRTIDFGDELNQPLTGTVALGQRSATLVCNSAFHGFDEVGSGSSQVSLSSGATLEKVVALPAEGQTATAKHTEAATTNGTDITVTAAAPVALTVTAGANAGMVGVSQITASGQSSVGRALDACSVPTTSAWFAVGATTVESSAELVIANPATNATTVNLKAWSATGPLDLAPAITVPASTSVYVNLAAYYPDQERLAVQATSAGSAVAFSLQLAKLDGLTPQGIATVSPLKDPAQQMVLVDYDPKSRDGYLRLANPGDTPAHVNLNLLTTTGSTPLPGGQGIVVDEGAVFDISLDGLPAGPLSLQVDSDQPVVASALSYQNRGSDENGGTLAATRVWSPAALSTRLLTTVAAPSAQQEIRLTVTNPGSEDADVTAGTAQFTLPAHSTVTTVIPAAVREVTASVPVAASIAVVDVSTSASPSPSSEPTPGQTDPSAAATTPVNSGPNLVSVNAVTEADMGGSMTVKLRP